MYGAGLIRFKGNHLGKNGLIQVDDYTLDWEQGFPFEKPGGEVGFTLRQGLATSSEFKWIKTRPACSGSGRAFNNFFVV